MKKVSLSNILLLERHINFNKEVMLAGNIQVDDALENYKKIADIIDISEGVETSGSKRYFQNRNFLKQN